ncbi:hypothetical protein AGLY_002244 [Aphis glycines]|uniref:Uncharacterized protein n=1 Tax=Aphis glycines TaxID=307491 RepID=A0A6G0U2Y9_APHGL|nr:hypothetical protein AGLY_002244 [Aphis glycines]
MLHVSRTINHYFPININDLNEFLSIFELLKLMKKNCAVELLTLNTITKHYDFLTTKLYANFRDVDIHHRPTAITTIAVTMHNIFSNIHETVPDRLPYIIIFQNVVSIQYTIQHYEHPQAKVHRFYDINIREADNVISVREPLIHETVPDRLPYIIIFQNVVSIQYTIQHYEHHIQERQLDKSSTTSIIHETVPDRLPYIIIFQNVVSIQYTIQHYEHPQAKVHRFYDINIREADNVISVREPLPKYFETALSIEIDDLNNIRIYELFNSFNYGDSTSTCRHLGVIYNTLPQTSPKTHFILTEQRFETQEKKMHLHQNPNSNSKRSKECIGFTMIEVYI